MHETWKGKVARKQQANKQETKKQKNDVETKKKVKGF
jgi:hypothetical protein